MTKKLFILAIAVIFSTFAYSQKNTSAPTADQRAAKITDKMTKDLSLNQTQVAKVKEINLAAAKRNDDIAKQKKADPNVNSKTLMMNSEATRDADLQKVLTPDQFTKYKQLKETKKQEVQQKTTSIKASSSAKSTATPATKSATTKTTTSSDTKK